MIPVAALGTRQSAADADRLLDVLGNIVSVLVLPAADDGPASGAEPLIGVSIPLLIALDFLRPVPAVGSMNAPAVLGAAVPEASVDEDGDPWPREHDVGLPPEMRLGATVDEVAQAETVKGPTQGKLRSGVTAALVAHAPSGDGR